MTEGETLQFSLRGAKGVVATWSVVPAGSGTISPSGLFTASQVLGAAKVVANWACAHGHRGTATADVAVVGVPRRPVLELPDTAEPKEGGLKATAAEQDGCTFSWSIQNGKFTSARNRRTVTFEAGPFGEVKLACVATNAARKASEAGEGSFFIVAAPLAPGITAPVHVTAGQKGYVATTHAEGDEARYAWSITNGTIDSVNGPKLLFTAGAKGNVNLVCIVTRAEHRGNGRRTGVSAIVDQPIIDSFSAAPITVKYGTPTTLSYVFEAGQDGWGTIDHGVGTVASGGSSAVTPSATTDYTLTATNSAGYSVTWPPLTVTVLPTLTANATSIVSGQSTTLNFGFMGSGQLSDGSTTISVDGLKSLEVSPTTNTTYTLTVGTATTDPVTVTVAPPAQKVSLGSVTTAAYRTAGSPTTITLTGSTGQLGPVTWTASAGTMDASTGAWTAPALAQVVTITATCENASPTSATALVQVVAAPTASLVLQGAAPLYGALGFTLVPTIGGATKASVGTTPQGGATVPLDATTIPIDLTSPMTSPLTYWLYVTNAAEDTASYPLKITPQTVEVSPIAAPSADLTTGESMTFEIPLVTGGVTATKPVTWTATLEDGSSYGSWSDSTWTAPLIAVPDLGQPVTITATSVDDPSKSVTTIVTVRGLVTTSLTASLTAPDYGSTAVTVTPVFPLGSTARLGTTEGGSELGSTLDTLVSGKPVPIQPTGLTTATTVYLQVSTNSVPYTTTITPVMKMGEVSPNDVSLIGSGSTQKFTVAVDNAYNVSLWQACVN